MVLSQENIYCNSNKSIIYWLLNGLTVECCLCKILHVFNVFLKNRISKNLKRKFPKTGSFLNQINKFDKKYTFESFQFVLGWKTLWSRYDLLLIGIKCNLTSEMFETFSCMLYVEHVSVKKMFETLRLKVFSNPVRLPSFHR